MMTGHPLLQVREWPSCRYLRDASHTVNQESRVQALKEDQVVEQEAVVSRDQVLVEDQDQPPAVISLNRVDRHHHQVVITSSTSHTNTEIIIIVHHPSLIILQNIPHPLAEDTAQAPCLKTKRRNMIN